jgi:hypothetical protein
MIAPIKSENQILYPLQTTYTAKNTTFTTSLTNECVIKDILAYDTGCYRQDEISGGETENEKWEDLVQNLYSKEEYFYELLLEGYDITQLTSEEITTYSHEKKNNEEEDNSKEKTKEKIDRILEKTDSMYYYAMTSGQPITIANLYKGSYAGGEKKNGTSCTPTQISSLLARNGLQESESNQWAVSKLMDLGIEITSSDVVKLQNLDAVVQKLADYAYGEEDSMDEDTALMEEEKILYIEKDIQDIVDELTEVDDKIIEQVISEGKEVTIRNLREAMLKGTQKVLDAQHTSRSNLGENETAFSKETIKEQIREIRAKLNVETAIRLSEKMPLESTQLAKVAEALTQIQEEVAIEALNKTEVPVTQENVSAVTDMMQIVEAMKRQPQKVVNVQVESNEQATIQTIHQAVIAYEENETVAEDRFGENLKKIENQVKDLLQKLEISATHENQVATKALIASQMEVTPNRIEEVSTIVNKVETFLSDMTPTVVAKLVKEGFSLYQLNINEVVSWLGEEKVPQLKENIAEMIVSLSDKKQVTEEQKQSLLGLYQILDKVEKNKEEVIGYLYKNQLPLTVEKLQEATKYSGQTTHLEKTIDDKFGELEELNTYSETAREKILLSEQEVKKLVDVAKMLENMTITPTREHEQKITQMLSTLYPMIKSEVKKELGHFEGIETLPDSFLEKLETIKNLSEQTIALLSESDIPITVSNVYWMEKMVQDPKLYGIMLQENNLLEEGFPESFEEFEEKLARLNQTVTSEKESSLSTGRYDRYKDFKQISEMLGFQKTQANLEGYYQIPFLLDGEMKLVNLYIEDDKQTHTAQEKSTLKATIRYETAHLGQVEAILNLDKEQIEYQITVEHSEYLGQLAAQQKQLDKFLEQLGYSIAGAKYYTDLPTHSPQEILKRGESDFEVIV